MVIAKRYLVTLVYQSDASIDFSFNSILEVKQFLKNVIDDTSINIRVYQVLANLNTTTHAVTFTQTELTEW